MKTFTEIIGKDQEKFLRKIKVLPNASRRIKKKFVKILLKVKYILKN